MYWLLWEDSYISYWPSFYRNNSLQMDIYYKELRHEQIDQQEAYNIVALLCKWAVICDFKQYGGSTVAQ